MTSKEERVIIGGAQTSKEKQMLGDDGKTVIRIALGGEHLGCSVH